MKACRLRVEVARLRTAPLIIAVMAGFSVMDTSSALAQHTLLVPAAREAGALSATQSNSLRSLESQATTNDVNVVRVNLGALATNRVSLSLGSKTVHASKRKTLVRNATDFTWIADLQEPKGQAVLVVRRGTVTGSIQSGLDHYTLTPMGGDLHALTKVDQSKFPKEHPPGPVRRGLGTRSALSPALLATAAAADGQVYVDVLIAYTSAARLAYRGDMAAFAQLAVDSANIAYSNSNAGVVLRLVGTTEVAYTESTFDQALTDLTNGTGVMAQVHTARDQTGADVVSLLINNSQFCGEAWVYSTASSAFSTAYWSCAVSNYSFAHELGHNFGAIHDPYVEPSNYPFPYSHGYVNGNSWRTIMAYSTACGGCPRLQYFSNPNVLYQGVPMGSATTHDAARVHRERAAVVAGFRTPASSTYVLSLNTAPDTGGTAAGAGSYPAGTTVMASAAAAAGYSFAGWTENGSTVSTSASYSFALNSDRMLAANFQPIPDAYVITLQPKPGAGGVVSGSGSYSKGSLRTVTAVANTGYAFASWTEGKKIVSVQPSYTFGLTSDRSLAANFKRAKIVADGR
jgi:peptidyl-Asp metalloendopeptidase